MRSSTAEDTLAIDIYRQAEATGETITLGTIERRLDELLGHERGCECRLVRPGRRGAALGCLDGRQPVA